MCGLSARGWSFWPATRVAVASVPALALSATARPARATGPQPELHVVGACPDATVVRALLAQLITPEQAAGQTVVIQDRGAHVRIAVGGAATTFDDPARDCAARARAVSVVAAAALQHPSVVLGPPIWTIEKGLVIELTSSRGAAKSAIGAEMRGALGSGPWSVFGAAGARGPITLELEGGPWKAELLRFPLDAGARLTSYRWRLRPWLGLGASATVTRIIGHDLIETDSAWRMGLGALAMFGATLAITKRLGLAAALSIRWEPRPYQLQVVPHGTVGETPTWWFTISLNYTLDGKRSSP
jgi:hypothetical protein